MKCHYFKQNTELYRVQLYNSLWMGAIESIYLTFYSTLKIFLVFLPHYLHYGPKVTSHGLQQTWADLVFPNHFSVVPSLPHPPRFLHSCLFRECLNRILICQVFIYCHQLSPHGTFLSWRETSQEHTDLRFERETEKDHRWQRRYPKALKKKSTAVILLYPQLWTHQLFPLFSHRVSGLKASWH